MASQCIMKVKKNSVAEKADVTGAEENENEMVFYRIKILH